MSENRAHYNVDGVLPKTLMAFRNRPCALPNSGGRYQRPTPDEIDCLIKLAGWSQTDVAKLVGVAWNNKGSTTVRKWKTSSEKNEYRPIPYAVWRHLLSCAGIVSSDDDVAALMEVSESK